MDKSVSVVPLMIVSWTRHGTQTSDLNVSSYSMEASIVVSTLLAARIVHATAELSKDVLDTCASFACATLRSVLVDSNYAVRMVPYEFCELAMY